MVIKPEIRHYGLNWMAQLCENKNLAATVVMRETVWLLCGTGFPSPTKKKNTSTLLFRAQQPLFLISPSISSIGLAVCSGLWTNSPFYSASFLTALMARTAQRRANYRIAHGGHTAPQLYHFKKHKCVTRHPDAALHMWWTRIYSTLYVCIWKEKETTRKRGREISVNSTLPRYPIHAWADTNKILQ